MPRWCSTRPARRGHHRDRRRRPGRSGHRPHRRRLGRHAGARAPATRCRRSRPASWRSPTSSSSTRPTATAPIGWCTAIESNLALQTFGEGEWRPPVLKTEATTGARRRRAVGRRFSAFRAHTAGERRAAPQRARHEFRLRELLAQRFLAHVEQAVLPPGEFDALVERIAAREIDPVLRGRRRARRGRWPARRVDEGAARSHRHRRAATLRHGAGVLPRRARPRGRGAGGGASAARARALHAGRAARRSSCSRRPRRTRRSPGSSRSAAPGCITSRCASTTSDAALAQLKARGVRLVDETPRPGAEGALVAFIHPSAAHGVLVELKQPARAAAPRAVRTPARYALGDLRADRRCHDGFFRLDGGAMFGVVPRTLWETAAPPDDRNRIPLGDAAAARRGDADACSSTPAAATRWTRRARTSTASTARYHLDHALAEAGLSRRRHRHRRSPPTCTSITSAASPTRDADGALVPRFPQRALRRASRRVGRRDASARAQPRQLPAGELRAARRRPASLDAGRRRRRDHAGRAAAADRRPHRAPPGRDDRVGGRDGGVRRRHDPDRGAPPDPWVMGYDLYPDGHAGVQARASPARPSSAST